MCLIWLLFIVAVVLPIVGKLVEEPDSGLGQTVLIIVAAVAALVALALIWRRLAARPGTEGAQLRVPDPATVARLDWPRNLSRVELEAFCTAFLRGQGWKVAPMLSEVAGSTYLDARGASARALLLCEPDGATLDPVSVRTRDSGGVRGARGGAGGGAAIARKNPAAGAQGGRSRRRTAAAGFRPAAPRRAARAEAGRGRYAAASMNPPDWRCQSRA